MATARSRRWHSHQPNVPGRGIVASYSARFWAIAVGLGVLTGAAASALMGLLHVAEHLAYGYNSGSYLVAVQSTSDGRRVIAMLVAALIVAGGAAILHRLPTSGGAEVSEALWLHNGRMSLLPSLARAVLSIVTVGLGVVARSRGRTATRGRGAGEPDRGLGEAAGVAAPPARRVRRRSRLRSGLQRAAGRRPVRARGVAGNDRAAARAAGAGRVGDRHRDRLDHAWDRAHLPHADLRTASRADGLGGTRRAGDRRRRRGLGTDDRARGTDAPSPARPVYRARDRVRLARGGLDQVSAAARQRPVDRAARGDRARSR